MDDQDRLVCVFVKYSYDILCLFSNIFSEFHWMIRYKMDTLYTTDNCQLSIELLKLLQSYIDSRTRIARIPDRSNTLADSYFVSVQFWTHIIVVVAIFTSQNRPKCEFNSHFGQFWLVKMAPTTSSYRSLTVLEWYYTDLWLLLTFLLDTFQRTDNALCMFMKVKLYLCSSVIIYMAYCILLC